jgi:hypothetical protein
MSKLASQSQRIALILLLALLFSFWSGEGQAENLPAGWTTYPDGDAIRCASYSILEWQVSLSPDGKLLISGRPRSLIHAESLRTKLPRGFKRDKEMIGNEALLKITHGWLVGFDAGEFGGGLWFVDSVGQSHKLTGENVHGLMSTPQGTLVFVGLSHLGLDTGKVLLVDDSSGSSDISPFRSSIF